MFTTILHSWILQVSKKFELRSVVINEPTVFWCCFLEANVQK